MADNFLSYNRFTTLPPVIAQFGWTPEEAAATQGKPDPNPVVSPMAAPAVTGAFLALVRDGSDKMRLALPSDPEQNPFEGPKPTLSLSRNAVRKLGGNVIAELNTVLQSGAVKDKNVQALMLDSIRRVVGLREFLGHINQLTEGINVRRVAASHC